jgi:hypothetical protein
VDAKVLLEDSDQHHHPVVSLGVVELAGILPELVEMPIRFASDRRRPAIERSERFFDVQFFSAGQAFGAAEIDEGQVLLFELLARHRREVAERGEADRANRRRRSLIACWPRCERHDASSDDGSDRERGQPAIPLRRSCCRDSFLLSALSALGTHRGVLVV